MKIRSGEIIRSRSKIKIRKKPRRMFPTLNPVSNLTCLPNLHLTLVLSLFCLSAFLPTTARDFLLL